MRPPLIGKGSTARRRLTMRARRGRSSSARAISARSIAHEWLPASSKPSGELKRVHDEPEVAGALVHALARSAATVPLMRWASAMAASLPEGSSSPLSIVSSLMRLPLGSTPTAEPL